jgi:phosphoserine phosphatase
MLGIPLSNVFANTILFNEDGSYKGFDPAEFPSRSGGKAEAVKHIKKVGAGRELFGASCCQTPAFGAL